MKNALLAGLALLFSTVLLSQATIRGTVTDPSGTPLVGATILLVKTGQGTATDPTGNFAFGDLPLGTYTVRATFVGYEESFLLAELAAAEQSVSLLFQLRESVAQIEALTVSATRVGDKMPFTHETVGREKLQEKNLGQDVPYLLDATPSVVTTSDGGTGIGYTGIRIRGTDATRINVTINGIPLNDAESQGVFWVNLPDLASSTESIQVQRGVGTSTNGAAAFGATINLNTSQLAQLPYAEAALSTGSFNTLKTTARFGSGLLSRKHGDSTGKEGITLDGRLSRIVSDGYIDRASADLNAFYLSGTYFGEKNSLRANVFSGHEVTYQAWYGVPAQYMAVDSLRTYNPAGTARPGSPYPNEVDDYRQTHYQLIFNQLVGENWHLNLTGHYTRGMGFFENYQVLGFAIDTCLTQGEYALRKWLDNHFFGGIWSAAYQAGGSRLQLTVGGGANRYLGSHFDEFVAFDTVPCYPDFAPGHRTYDDDGDKLDMNAFMKLQYRFSPRFSGFLDLQGRVVDYRILQRSYAELAQPVFTSTASKYHFFNPKLGVFYEVTPRVSIYSSFAVGQKEPNRSDFVDAPGGRLPRPERLYNTEAGVRGQLGRVGFSANFYHMAYQDQLVLTGNINDVGAPIRINVPNSFRAGLETAVVWQLTDKWRLEGNASFSKNKIKDFMEFIDNWDTGLQDSIRHGTTDLAFSPNLVAFGQLSYQLLSLNRHALTVSVSCKQVGRQFLDNTSNENTQLNAYSVWDGRLRYIWRPAWASEISLDWYVNNLLGERYASNAWTYRFVSGADAREWDPYARLEGGNVYNLTGFFPQAGRNFLLGLTVKI